MAVVGALFGRKTLSATNVSRAATGIRKTGRVAKEKEDVKRTEKNITELQQELEELAFEIEDRIDEIAATFSVNTYEVETFAIQPRRRDIFDVRVFLIWEICSTG